MFFSLLSVTSKAGQYLVPVLPERIRLNESGLFFSCFHHLLLFSRVKQNRINLPFTGEGVDVSCVMAALRRRVMDAARNVDIGAKTESSGQRETSGRWSPQRSSGTLASQGQVTQPSTSSVQSVCVCAAWTCVALQHLDSVRPHQQQTHFKCKT